MEQFPIKNEIKEVKVEKKINPPKKYLYRKYQRLRKKTKKTREINLYSPEYLKKKHGINLNAEEKSIPKLQTKKVQSVFTIRS